MPVAQRKFKPDSQEQSKAGVHNRTFFRLFQLGNALQRQSTRELGITTVQWAVLGALSRDTLEGGMTVLELTDYLMVSRQNLDSVLKRLEQFGHVVRVQDETDRRARRVQLTADGKHYWDGLQPGIYEFYRQSMQSFRFDESIALVHFLNRLQGDLVKVRVPRSARPAANP